MDLELTGAFGADEMRQLLIGELDHRVKNTPVTVQSLAKQTLRGAEHA